MYTSYIGKQFLELYNLKEQKDYSAEEFFNEKLFPLFFNDERHFMHVHGSSFFQKVSEKDIPPGKNKHSYRLSRLQNDIRSGKISGSTYVGYAAETVQAVSSGQVSSIIGIAITTEEIYSSWIGHALSLGVEGRYCLLISNDKLLWAIYQGWKYYRIFLDNTPHVKDKEIEFWNTIWLLNVFDNSFDIPININIDTDTSVGETRIRKATWSKLVYEFCRNLPLKTAYAYCYKLDKTNTTIGFINIILHKVNEIFEFRDKIFIPKDKSVLSDKEISELLTHYTFYSACKLGSIGLKSLEPAGIREYMPWNSVPGAKGKDLKLVNEESYKYYQLYKIWITAMLNKTDLLHLAEGIAGALHKFETEDERGKKVHATISSEIRESKSIVRFIENLSNLTIKSDTDKELLKNVVDEVLKMPPDNFPLFITLIRFEYNFQKH